LAASALAVGICAPANKKLAVVRVVDARAARTAVRAVMVAVRVTV
jgi:hypothetical protein